MITENRIKDWIKISAFENVFDWTKSFITDFKTLFENVTFHDSTLATTHLNFENKLIISFCLDVHWNKEYSYEAETDEDWPYLIIKINDVINLYLDTKDSIKIISDFTTILLDKNLFENLRNLNLPSEILPLDLFKRLSNLTEIHKTKFCDVGGGGLELLHGREIEIILVTEKGEYLEPSFDRLKTNL